MAKAARTGSQTSERIEAFAEDLGRLLGTARAKADSWMSQREQIAKQLAEIRDTASKLLTDLGQQARSAMRGRGGRKTQEAPRRRRRRRKMSAAARAKISEAQRLRWARQKREAARGEKK
jgi:hypothetical protein